MTFESRAALLEVCADSLESRGQGRRRTKVKQPSINSFVRPTCRGRLSAGVGLAARPSPPPRAGQGLAWPQTQESTQPFFPADKRSMCLL